MVVQIVVYSEGVISGARILCHILAVPGLSVGHVPHVSVALEVGGHVTVVRFLGGVCTERGAPRLALST